MRENLRQEVQEDPLEPMRRIIRDVFRPLLQVLRTFVKRERPHDEERQQRQEQGQSEVQSNTGQVVVFTVV